MNINQSVLTILEGLIIPLDRVRANNCYIHLRRISEVCNVAKSLPAEQLEWLSDAIKDKRKEMYPDRYTDHSTPLLRDELVKLELEKKQVSEHLALLEELEKQVNLLLPKKAKTSLASDLFFENDLEGM